MADKLTKEQRSYCMSQNKGKDTKPEVSQAEEKNWSELNVDSRDGLGYTVSRWYIIAPPGGTILLRRL